MGEGIKGLCESLARSWLFIMESNGTRARAWGFLHIHSHLFQPVERRVHGGLLRRVSSLRAVLGQSLTVVEFVHIFILCPGLYMHSGSREARRVMPSSSESTSIGDGVVQVAAPRLSPDALPPSGRHGEHMCHGVPRT